MGWSAIVVTPPIYVKNFIADRAYGPIEEARVPSSQKLITFEFLGISTGPVQTRWSTCTGWRAMGPSGNGRVRGE